VPLGAKPKVEGETETEETLTFVGMFAGLRADELQQFVRKRRRRERPAFCIFVKPFL
jgi:hypothetical protein